MERLALAQNGSFKLPGTDTEPGESSADSIMAVFRSAGTDPRGNGM